MQANLTYPRWYHTLRGFVIGLAAGCAAMTLAYESAIVPAGNVVWQHAFALLAINVVPLTVLGLFEIGFAIQRYRAVRQEMGNR